MLLRLARELVVVACLLAWRDIQDIMDGEDLSFTRGCSFALSVPVPTQVTESARYERWTLFKLKDDALPVGGGTGTPGAQGTFLVVVSCVEGSLARQHRVV